MLKRALCILLVMSSAASARELTFHDILKMIAPDHAAYEPLTDAQRLDIDGLDRETVARLASAAGASVAPDQPEPEETCAEGWRMFNASWQEQAFWRIDRFLDGRSAIVHAGENLCSEGSGTTIWLQEGDVQSRTRAFFRLEGELRYIKRGQSGEDPSIDLVVKEPGLKGQSDVMAFYTLEMNGVAKVEHRQTKSIVIGSYEIPETAVEGDTPVLAQPVLEFVLPDKTTGAVTGVYRMPDPDPDMLEDMKLTWDDKAISAPTPFRVRFTYVGEGGSIWRYIEALAPLEQRYLGWILPRQQTR